jgi:hypothetical protein
MLNDSFVKCGLILFVSFLFGLSACQNTIEEFDSSYEGTAYFPLAVGNTWIYQLDSVIYDNNGLKVDSSSLQIKETITESYIDDAGDEVFRVQRARRNAETSPWFTTDIWTASKTQRKAYRVEENLRFAKLNFPVVEGKSWDGNAYIDENVIVKIGGEPIRIFKNWGNYRYSSVGISEQLNGQFYDSVCLVEQVDIEDKISKRFAIEKYALGFGLIYKEMTILDTQKFDSNDPWVKKAEQGFILKQSLISFNPG